MYRWCCSGRGYRNKTPYSSPVNGEGIPPLFPCGRLVGRGKSRKVEVMLWFKAFHIIFVISWFAGLFYLPRIYVNMSMASQDAERERLLLMAQKLFRFMTPLAVLALAFGIWLWLG